MSELFEASGVLEAWLVCSPKFGVRVATDRNGIIREAAPLVRKFIGQPVGNLLKWGRKFGRVTIERIPL